MFSTSCKNPDFVAINAQFVKSPLITAVVPSAGRICCSSFSITVWFTDTGRKKMSGNGGWKFVSLFFFWSEGDWYRCWWWWWLVRRHLLLSDRYPLTSAVDARLLRARACDAGWEDGGGLFGGCGQLHTVSTNQSRTTRTHPPTHTRTECARVWCAKRAGSCVWA